MPQKNLRLPPLGAIFLSTPPNLNSLICPVFIKCLSPLTLWVWISVRWGVLDTTLWIKVYQWLATSSMVLSGFSGFFHQWNWPPRYNWNIVESGVKHNNPNLCLQYQIRNDSGELRNNASLEFINKLYSLYKIRNSYSLSFSLYYDRNLSCSWLRSSSISGASILYRVTDITVNCAGDAINVYNGKWCCLDYNYISKKGCLKIQKG